MLSCVQERSGRGLNIRNASGGSVPSAHPGSSGDACIATAAPAVPVSLRNCAVVGALRCAGRSEEPNRTDPTPGATGMDGSARRGDCYTAGPDPLLRNNVGTRGKGPGIGA